MKKLRILFQTPIYLPERGGIEISTSELAEYFIKGGHEVSVLCEKKEDKQKDFEKIKGVSVYRIPKIELPRYLKSLTFIHKQIKIKTFEKDFFKKHEFDVIVSRFSFFVKSTKKITKTPLIYLQPAIFYIAMRESARNTQGFLDKFNQYVRSMTAFFIERKACKMANLVLTRSQAMKWIDKNRFKIEEKKIRFFRQGIDLKKFYPRKREGLKKKLNLKDKNVILTVSRLTPDKNNSGLIKIFSKLKDKNSILVIVGGGKEEKELKELVKKLKIQKRVRFLGNQKRPERFYNIADIFVLASKQEGFGKVYLEAMASSLPILGFKSNPPKRISALSDIINNKNLGFAVEKDEEIGEKIDLLLKEEKLREKMGKTAKRESEKYSWKEISKKLLKDIERVIKST